MTPDNREEQVREALGRVTQMVAPGAEWVEIEAADWATIRAHIEALEAWRLSLSEQVAAVTGWCASANQRADNAEARVRELQGFAQDVMEVWPEGDVDGGSLQEFAVRHGLLRPVMMAAPCGDDCCCAGFLSAGDWPSECFRHTSLLTGKPESDAAIDSAMQGEEVRGG